MSLKSRSIVFLLFLSSALLAWACGASEPGSPGAPGRFVITGPSAAQQTATDVPVFGESSEVIVAEDDPPAPGPTPGPPAPPPPPPDPNLPWEPGPPPRPAPGAPVPALPNTHQRLKVKIDPPVVYMSGRPILDVPSCRDSALASKNTWFYDQIISTETGVPITITERENFFDGRFASRVKDTIKIGGNSGYTIHSRWCSGYNTFHYVQTRLKGQDDYGERFVLEGPVVRLYPR
jgi:hypothetical protein